MKIQLSVESVELITREVSDIDYLIETRKNYTHATAARRTFELTQRRDSLEAIAEYLEAAALNMEEVA